MRFSLMELGINGTRKGMNLVHLACKRLLFMAHSVYYPVLHLDRLTTPGRSALG